MIICKCKGITKREIQRAIKNGAQTLGDVQKTTGASTGCGRCKSFVEALVNEERLKINDPQLRIEFD